MTMPLNGIRIIDFSDHASGPVCSLTLADLGAEVIKIEPVGGEKSRRWGSARYGENNEFSSIFAALNRNKQSVAVNLKTAEGLALARRLIESADVLLENMRVGVMNRLGLGYEDCQTLNERLVYCSLTAFGTQGPLAGNPGFDLLMQAYAGPLSITGEADRPAVRIGPSAIDFLTGTLGSVAILAALQERTVSGKGQRVDTSLYGTALHLMTHFMADYSGTGKVPGRTGPYFSFLAPYGIFMASDREIYIGASTDKMWKSLCSNAGWSDLIDDERFAATALRAGRQVELYDIIVPRIQEHPAAYWLELCQRSGIPSSLIQEISEIVQQEQAAANDYIIEIPGLESLRSAGLPIKLSRTPGLVRSAPPSVGEHTDAVLTQLGYQASDIAELVRKGVVTARSSKLGGNEE